MSTSSPAHLFAIRGKRKRGFFKIALGTRLRSCRSHHQFSVLFAVEQPFKVQIKEETLRVVTIAMISSILVSLWKLQYFRRPIHNPVEHLWWGLYCENSKPLSIFTKELYHRCSLWFLLRLYFLKILQTFYYFKILYIITLLISVKSLASRNLGRNNMEVW